MKRSPALQISVFLLAIMLAACQRSKRPAASGEVGAVFVYGQTKAGATRLMPEKLATLHRPQRFTFELNVEGTGPRSVYIEIHTPERQWRMFNERLNAPKNNWYFDYVLKTDERLPPRFDLVTKVDAPHSTSVSSRFPIRLLRGQSFPSKLGHTQTATRSIQKNGSPSGQVIR